MARTRPEVNSLSDILRLRDEIKAIAARHGAQSLQLAGSFAHDAATPESDVDFIAYVGGQTSPWFPMGLIEDLEAFLGRKVDVATPGALPEEFREQMQSGAIEL